MRSWLLLTISCVSLIGCGQTGNLYLPDKDAEVVSTPSDPAATAESTAEAERKRNEATRPPAPQ